MCTNAPGVSLWAEESLEEELELQAVVIHYMDDGNWALVPYKKQ